LKYKVLISGILILAIFSIGSFFGGSSIGQNNERAAAKIKLDSLQMKYDTLFTDNTSLEQEHSSLKSSYESLEASNNLLNKNYNDLQAEHSRQITAYNSLQTDYKSLQTAHLELQADYVNKAAEYNTLLKTALQPPYVSISGREIIWAWIDSGRVIHYWELPIDTYRYWIERPEPTQRVNLNTTNGVVSMVDFRPYMVPDTFRNVIPPIASKYTDGIAFAKEMFNLVTSLTVYSSDIGETPRWPAETMTEAGGDCEDVAILFAALLKASSFNYTLRLVYMDMDHPDDPVSPNHVFIEVTYSGQTVYVDCTSKSGWNCWSSFTGWFFPIS